MQTSDAYINIQSSIVAAMVILDFFSSVLCVFRPVTSQLPCVVRVDLGFLLLYIQYYFFFS